MGENKFHGIFFKLSENLSFHTCRKFKNFTRSEKQPQAMHSTCQLCNKIVVYFSSWEVLFEFEEDTI
jgi:hypothetical protein